MCIVFELDLNFPLSLCSSQYTHVVYFNQQTHTCACVRMVKNDKKHSKMSKKVLFSSCAREAHERLTCESLVCMKKKVLLSSFSYVFDLLISWLWLTQLKVLRF